jgi:uroporphyrinogen-III synthase
VDAITFTSSSTVRNFVALVGQVDNLPRRPVIACIGPITAQTARDVGLTVDLIADEYTADGLVSALANYFSYRL